MSRTGRFCRGGGAMRFCRMRATSTVGYFKHLYTLRAQLRRDLAADLMAALVLERPRPRPRIETDPDPPAGPAQAHGVRPVVQRHLPLAAHVPGHQVRGHQLPRPAEVP